MITLRLVISAGVMAMALASTSIGAQKQDIATKVTPKADKVVQDLLAGVGRHEVSPKVMKALRAMAPQRLSSALAYELLFYEHREATLQVLKKLPAMKVVEPALVHALQYGTNQQQLLAISLVRKWDVKAAIPVLLGDVLENDYVAYREIRETDSRMHWRSKIVAGVFSSACGALRALTDGKIGMRLSASGATGCYEPAKAKWRAWWKVQGPRLYPDVYRKESNFSSEKDVMSFCQKAIGRWGPNVENRVRKALRNHAAEYNVPPRPNRKNIRPEKLNAPRELWCESGMAVLLQEAVLAGRAPSKADDAARSRQRLALMCIAKVCPADAGSVVSALDWLRRSGRVFDDVAWVEALRNKHCPAAATLLGKVLGEVKDPKTLFQGVDVLGSMVCLEAFPALVGMIGRVSDDDGYDRRVIKGLRSLMSRGPMHEKIMVKTLIPLLSHRDDSTSLAALATLGSAMHKPYIKAAISAIESAAAKWTGEKKRVAKVQLYRLRREQNRSLDDILRDARL